MVGGFWGFRLAWAEDGLGCGGSSPVAFSLSISIESTWTDMAIGDPATPPATLLSEPAMAPWTIPEMAWANSGGKPVAPEMPEMPALTETLAVSVEGLVFELFSVELVADAVFS